ncbi:hypothetical protein [Tessaracoccus coleopterorum]|uniref:hypothetical protein n=1 Tax=Tessaracoccus coleopterorum TaxID=2714950 RepID=UPI001E4626A9|nr:hypothetical protein [Tessaracoccus coleopterorum]
MTDFIDIAAPEESTPVIDPADLEVALRVLGTAHRLPADHPDFHTLREATSAMYKSVRRQRRRDVRDAVSAADREVIARTATGAPDRIDDETRGSSSRRRWSRPAQASSCGRGPATSASSTTPASMRSTTSSALPAPPSATASATPAPI